MFTTLLNNYFSVLKNILSSLYMFPTVSNTNFLFFSPEKQFKCIELVPAVTLTKRMVSTHTHTQMRYRSCCRAYDWIKIKKKTYHPLINMYKKATNSTSLHHSLIRIPVINIDLRDEGVRGHIMSLSKMKNNKQIFSIDPKLMWAFCNKPKG